MPSPTRVAPDVVGAVEQHNDLEDENESTGIMQASKVRDVEKLDEAVEADMKSTAPPSPMAHPVPEEPKLWGIPMKWLSLVLLTVQTSGQALLIRWSKSQTAQVKYLSSTAVCLTEVLKTVCSVGFVVMESDSAREAAATLTSHFTENPKEVLKAAVPSLIYTIQNNLMFYSFDKLSAPVQQVLYQMKILTTAGLGVLMLGKSLTATKWSSCFMLAAGVALVQWPRKPAEAEHAPYSGGVDIDKVKGFVAVLLACFTSGFAAVFIQKMLQQTTASIWVRNVQFGMFGSIMGVLLALVQDWQLILEGGFFQGYNIRVISVIAMNAIGGLLCAIMLKYAGATLGCFSTALSLILTCALSWAILQDFHPDGLFVIGTVLAIVASLLYGLGLPESLTSRCGGSSK